MGFRQILDLTISDAASGIIIADMPELDPFATGVGPQSAEMFVIAHGFAPNDPFVTLGTFPMAQGNSGTDESGNIGTDTLMENSGDDKLYIGSGFANFDSGFFQATCIALLNVPPGTPGITIDITVEYDPTDISGYDPTLVDPPDNLDLNSSSFDPDKNRGTLTFSFDYNNDHSEDPIGFAVKRDLVVVGSIPFTSGTTHYTYTDSIFNPSGTYSYTVSAYRYSDTSVSGDSGSIDVSFGPPVVPDIDATGSGGITFGGTALVVILADPSGLYTLVADKTNDTLYDRLTNSTQDVKIPDPFIKTGFIGG